MIRRGLTFLVVCLIMYAGLRLFGVLGLFASAALIAGIGELIELRGKRRGRL